MKDLCWDISLSTLFVHWSIMKQSGPDSYFVPHRRGTSIDDTNTTLSLGANNLLLDTVMRFCRPQFIPPNPVIHKVGIDYFQ